MFKFILNTFAAGKHSILMARIGQLSGLAVAGVGAMDWAQLIQLAPGAMNWQSFVILGGTVFAQGLLTEIARRYKATDIH